MAEVCWLVDGFDDYSVAADFVAGGWSVGNPVGTGNVAGNSMNPATSQNPTHNHPADAWIHELFAFRTTNAATAGTLWRSLETGTEHLRLAYNGNGTFTLSRAGTNVGTTPISANLGIVANTFYHVEILARVHDTAGQYDVWINGVLACTGGGSALDTRNGGTAGTPDQTSFTQNGAAQVFQYDDFLGYVGSGGAQKGIARVITKFATGDGANTAWTASSGTDVSCIDETVPNADTDYISSLTAGQRDTFTYPGLGVTGTVLAVGVTSLARKDDAGTRSIRGVVRQAATNFDGPTDRALTTTYVVYQDIWETDPNTAAAWSVAGVDSAEYGVKLTA